MQEQWSVSKEKLLNLEEGLSRKDGHLCVEVVKVNNSYKTVALCTKLTVYLGLLSLIGWSCYLIWQMPHIHLTEIRVMDILQEIKFQNIDEPELVVDKNLNLSVSSPEDYWNRSANSDIDAINKIDSDAVSLNNQIPNVTVAADDVVLSEKSELNAHRSEEDNTDTTISYFTPTPSSLLIKKESDSSEFLLSLNSQEYEYASYEELQQSKTYEIDDFSSQNYGFGIDSYDEFMENKKSTSSETTNNRERIISYLLMLANIDKQLMEGTTLDEVGTTSLVDINF